jgi:two-component system chemotaxis sensor kinase CheA
MDVVRRNINDLGGHVYIDSKPGRGSVLTIRLPLTLAIIDGQLVRVGEQMYVIPIMSISESLQLDPALVSRYKGKADLYKLRDEYIPILKLHDVFDNIDHQPGYDQGLMVVVEVERRRVGLFVDELLGQQQVVIKSLENNFRKAEGFSGATILGDGTVSLILDAVGLIRNYLEKSDKPVSTDRAAA